MRILPRTNDDINEEWISDKTRHVVDGLRTQRLDQPYVREGGKLRPATWTEAFNAIAAKVAKANPKRIGAMVGDLAAVEEIFALKDLMTRLGVGNLDCRQDGAALDPAWGRASYLFNATIAGIDSADALLIVGSNPRKEAAILNARIRKRWRAGKFPIGVIGPKADLTYTYDYLGAGPETLAAVARHSFADTLRKAERPMVLLGAGALTRGDGAAIASLAAKAALDLGAVKDGWNGFCVLHSAASRVGALDLGFVPGQGGLSRAADGGVRHARRSVLARRRRDRRRSRRLRHLYRHARRPRRNARRCGSARAPPIRKNRRLTSTPRAGCRWRRAPPSRPAMRAKTGRSCGRCRTCWDNRLPYDLLAALRRALFKAHPHLTRIGQVTPADAAALQKLAALGGAARPGAVRLERGRLLLHQSDRALLRR